jgi:hypothetical protein
LGRRSLFCGFQPVVHAGKAAFRLVAGDIKKFAFLSADRAGLRRRRLHDGVPAVAALPGIFGRGDRCFGHERCLLDFFNPDYAIEAFSICSVISKERSDEKSLLISMVLRFLPSVEMTYEVPFLSIA